MALEELPAGSYEVNFHCALARFYGDSLEMHKIDSFKLRIVDSAKLRQDRVEKMIVKLRAGDFFTQSVVDHYNIRPVIDALPPYLMSSSADEVRNIAEVLYRAKSLPTNTVGYVQQALSSLEKSDSSDYHHEVCRYALQWLKEKLSRVPMR